MSAWNVCEQTMQVLLAGNVGSVRRRSPLVEDDAVVRGEELICVLTVQPHHLARVGVAVYVLDGLPCERSCRRVEGECVLTFLGAIVPHPPFAGQDLRVVAQAAVKPRDAIADLKPSVLDCAGETVPRAGTAERQHVPARLQHPQALLSPLVTPKLESQVGVCGTLIEVRAVTHAAVLAALALSASAAHWVT